MKEVLLKIEVIEERIAPSLTGGGNQYNKTNYQAGLSDNANSGNSKGGSRKKK